ncbi:bifunctional folylpolyglutamate synthase/dihydrofolate synthase [Candidatus Saccharibacteria bacterium]|nr:bifunctional folylpolyglutamate synthase/dihydrofolate synthase [Candidatus Saccharibacteria bacterium]
MDLEFATEFFDQFTNFERIQPVRTDFRLDKLERLCEIFGRPERACPCFHVAGSKGKGSITTFSGSILKASGKKTVGLYRSPALTHFTDRISEVDGPFSEAVYRAAFDELKVGAEKFRRENPHTRLTYFELVTLYAFLVFREAKCDYAVYEVGLGGRLDATNVVDPKVAIISTIELEHTEILGDTLEKIAAEKAGIIKPGVPVVVSPQRSKTVKDVFRKVAQEKHAGELVFLPDELETGYFLDDEKRLKMHVDALDVDLRLVGDFQAKNALAAATAARLALPTISDEAVKSGLERASLPGRFEILTNAELFDFPKIPYLVLDGAHTEGSIKGSVATLATYRDLLAKERTYDSCLTDFALDEPPLLLFACARGKQVEEMSRALDGAFSEVILTKPGDFKKPDLPRAEQAFRQTSLKTTLIEDYQIALETALALANETSRGLVVLGSLYLVAEAKKYLRSLSPSPW